MPRADEAFVEFKDERTTSAVDWDVELWPPVPGMVLAPGMHDRLTALHECTHAIVNKGPNAVHSDELAHGDEFLKTFIDLLSEYCPELIVRSFRTAHRIKTAELDLSARADRAVARRPGPPTLGL